MKPNNIRKILFITLSNIGDAVLTLPVLTALKDNFPDAAIDVVVGPRPKDIFTKDPGIRNIFVYDKHAGFRQKLRFINMLRREGYDLAADMRSSLIPFLAGVKKSTPLISISKAAIKHKRSEHLDRLRALSIKYSSKKNIHVDDKDREIIDGLLAEGGLRKGDILIGVSPACRSHLKEWGIGGFAEVIKEILEKGIYKVVLIGDDSQVDISGKIKDAVGRQNLIDLTGKINLNELFALIERMQVLLTCDSAPLHIACDLGIKVVSIFGPTDPREYGPTGKGDIVIRKDIKCSPCRKARCVFSHECMSGVTADEVMERLWEILG